MSKTDSFKRFQKVKKIGEGTYGSVSKVYDHKLKIFIAVKKFKFHEDQETIPINALREIICLKQLNHPNIVKQNNKIQNRRINSISYELKKRKLYISYEYIQQTLEQYIKRIGSLSPYSVKVILDVIPSLQTIMYEILKALQYLQNKCYMHRDLKPQNIMLTKDIQVKLIDFGQAKKISLQNLLKEKQTLEVSTLWYKAPQLLLGHEYYSNKIEIWSLGCIFVEMITGQPLFEGISQIEQIFSIFKRFGTPKLSENKNMKEWIYFSPTCPKFQENNIYIPIIGEQGNNLLQKMLEINPLSRINIVQALHHPYFYGLQ